MDEASARKYVAIDKDKVREGSPKERNPWENSLAEAERLPTMAFFVNGLKKESTWYAARAGFSRLRTGHTLCYPPKYPKKARGVESRVD